MCDMFFIMKSTCLTGNADNGTPFVVKDNTNNIIKRPGGIGETLIKWFSDNKVKLNSDKCHLPLNSEEPNTMKTGHLCIKKLLM